MECGGEKCGAAKERNRHLPRYARDVQLWSDAPTLRSQDVAWVAPLLLVLPIQAVPLLGREGWLLPTSELREELGLF